METRLKSLNVTDTHINLSQILSLWSTLCSTPQELKDGTLSKQTPSSSSPKIIVIRSCSKLPEELIDSIPPSVTCITTTLNQEPILILLSEKLLERRNNSMKAYSLSGDIREKESDGETEPV